MAKKGNSKKDKDAKKQRALLKQQKQSTKSSNKEQKLSKKFNDDSESEDEDLDTILQNFKKEQEQYHKITATYISKPPVRNNGCMVATQQELVIFGGEALVNDKLQFYNDLLVYNPKKNLWRQYFSQNSPNNRSSAAILYHPNYNQCLLFGGEFSSPKQQQFYHYKDTWVLNCSNKEWEKLDFPKSMKLPQGRSGAKFSYWKNYAILFGGFKDTGVETVYLQDCWVFDMLERTWKEIEFPKNSPTPDARSGCSLIPFDDGMVLYGGYTKVKTTKKNISKGKILNDLWILKNFTANDLNKVRWEKKRKQGVQPSPRCGTSWVSHKGRGVLFGGVFDYEETEESLESEFFNDLYVYSQDINRWYNLKLRKSKNKSNNSKDLAKSEKGKTIQERDMELENILNSILEKNNISLGDGNEEDDNEINKKMRQLDLESDEDEEEGDEELEDGSATADSIKKYEPRELNNFPHSRYNASTAVLGDNLYIYSGLWEMGDKEFAIDSFYSIDLNKLDTVKSYWEDLGDIIKAERDGIEDSDEEFEYEDEDDEEDDDDEDDEETAIDTLEAADEEDEEDLDEGYEFPDERPWLPHPKPFENLRAFYIRTGAEFLQWIINSKTSSLNHKLLKTKSFDLCESRWYERREEVRIMEDKFEEEFGVSGIEVIEKDVSVKPAGASKRR
ncbi:hypothetical protein QEN19_000272 [Hanseniaspora menglaensis]